MKCENCMALQILLECVEIKDSNGRTLFDELVLFNNNYYEIIREYTYL